MARTIRNPKLDTRSARAKLQMRKAPYWTAISPGCALGYRKGSKGGSWLAKYVRDGVRKESAIGPTDDALDAGGGVLSFADAQAKARDWFQEIERGDNGESGKSEPYTVSKALDDYMVWFRRHRKSVRDTERAIEAHIRPVLGDVEIRNLSPAAIRSWHHKLADLPARLRTKSGGEQRYRELPTSSDAKRARKSTANRVLTVLKAALNHAFDEGYAPSDDAWRRMKPFREANSARVRYLSLDECRRLLNACEPDIRRLVQAALLTGCRYGELTRLRVFDFSADAGTLLVREAKSGKSRHVPLDSESRTFFDNLTLGRAPSGTLFLRDNGNPWGRAHQVRPLAGASKAARLDPPANFHCLRHTWASHRIMAHAPLMVVAQVLGHSDTRMVEKHYGHLAPSFVRDAIERTQFGLGVEDTGNVAPLRQERQTAGVRKSSA